MVERAASTSSLAGTALMRPGAWLDHLRLVAELPYPAPVLMPTVLQVLRQGVRADFGTFTPLQPGTLRSGSILTEAFAPQVLRWLCAARDAALAAQSTEEMVRSDGESRRAYCLRPDYEDSELYRHIFQPLGARWSVTTPLLDGGDAAHGLLYLHRRAAHGPFTDAEQAALRQARLALRPLARAGAHDPDAAGDAVPRVALRHATLLLNAQGHMVSMGEAAAEMLYRSAAPGPNQTAWAEHNVQALPALVMDDALALLRRRAPAAARGIARRVHGQAGDYEFRLERMAAPGTGARGVAVHITHLEPADITLTRQLACWPLTPQEKRILVASLRAPDQYALAERLGISLNTLKHHVKDLVRRTGFESRSAMVAGVLEQATGAGRGTAIQSVAA